MCSSDLAVAHPFQAQRHRAGEGEVERHVGMAGRRPARGLEDRVGDVGLVAHHRPVVGHEEEHRGGVGREQLAEMQRIIDAEASDLFDVLAHVAYSQAPLTREVRAANARVYINTQFNAKQQAFLDFVLQHYVTVGVEELEQEKLTPLLRLK